jgi:hypothetical protein
MSAFLILQALVSEEGVAIARPHKQILELVKKQLALFAHGCALGHTLLPVFAATTLLKKNEFDKDH